MKTTKSGERLHGRYNASTTRSPIATRRPPHATRPVPYRAAARRAAAVRDRVPAGRLRGAHARARARVGRRTRPAGRAGSRDALQPEVARAESERRADRLRRDLGRARPERRAVRERGQRPGGHRAAVRRGRARRARVGVGFRCRTAGVEPARRGRERRTAVCVAWPARRQRAGHGALQRRGHAAPADHAGMGRLDRSAGFNVGQMCLKIHHLTVFNAYLREMSIFVGMPLTLADVRGSDILFRGTPRRQNSNSRRPRTASTIST
ncbi:hypothetical protein F01_70038 [Burkholderia cenocepacia]|nr:hypothetical protein F01_70038 [Burkholderia cenocepacia]